MNIINKFDEFNSINEKINLTEDEKKYFWSKIEYNKKKKAKENKTELYTVLTSDDDSEISNSDMINFLDSLEYSIKKYMKDPDKKFRNVNATSLQSKIPSDWIGIKYSSLSSKSKRDAKNKEKDK